MRAYLLLIAGLLVSGCIELLGEGEAGHPSTLYVSNQSFEQPSADIVVELDGVTLFDATAPVRDQHHWIPVPFNLTAGTHRLDASESRSGAQDAQTFTADGPRWIVVQYWTSPSRFTINVSDKQVAFD